MTTYRERRAARAERLRGWADKRDDKAVALQAANDPYRGDIAFATQPGHIPERARAIARTERAAEHHIKATSMRSRADNIKAQMDAAVYDDDPDAIERLEEKLTRLEAERDRIKAYNASCRRGERDITLLDDEQQRKLLACATAGQVKPNGAMPTYATSNLGATINTTRKRIARLKGAAT